VSRVGKAPIPIPDGVTIKAEQNLITVSGPKGQLSYQVHPELIVATENNEILVTRPTDGKIHRSLHGLTRTLIANMIDGITKGFEKRLEIVGVGYRAELKGRKLLLSLGYSHQILFAPPDSIQISVEGNNAIVIRGISKELVGQVAAKIRSFKQPEPYKGKGIRYAGEQVRKKAGKTAA
jgi:large subunit ribosomal protein L6